MTSLSRRRRKKAEKKHEVGPRRYSWGQYQPPAPPIRPQDAGLIAELNWAIEQYLDLSGIELERVAGLKSVAFGRKQRAYTPLAYVFADEVAQVYGVGRIPGNFRAAGEHWTELRALLVRIQGGLVPVTKSYDRLLTSTVSLSAELVASALRASARIRADLRVFPCPVVLESYEYQVRFEPIQRFPRLLLPFRVKQADGREIDAALDLTSTGDPIAVTYEPSADKAAVIEAWPVALLAFADLIGDHASDSSSQQASEPSEGESSRPSGPRTDETHRRLMSAGQGRPVSRSKRVRPVGQTANYHGTFVVGHRRHLPPGQSCNDDARAAARVYGIELAPGWTWVQPYERGTPDDFILRYVWQVPAQLGASDGAGLAGSVSG
jgi:hypothetical protein